MFRKMWHLRAQWRVVVVFAGLRERTAEKLVVSAGPREAGQTPGSLEPREGLWTPLLITELHREPSEAPGKPGSSPQRYQGPWSEF